MYKYKIFNNIAEDGIEILKNNKFTSLKKYLKSLSKRRCGNSEHPNPDY